MEAAEDKPLQEEADVPIQSQTESDGATEDAKGPEVCKFYLLGRCHFGDRCRLTHSASALTVSKDEQTEEKGSTNQNTSRNSGKPEKTKDEKTDDSKKKPRMRTADDVISRILWDSSVDPADFIVGHLDRFLGVLERPFSEFSWDTQVCDCDYSEEMAIPRHRIQYFSYKGQRVWDRDSRTDHVFGSTGQTVMPPFDREAKRQENTAPDSKQEVDQSPVEKTEKDNSIEHSLGGAIQEGTLNNAADTLNSNTNGSVVKERGASGLTLETEGLSISPHTEIKEEWKDNLDKDEEEEVAKEPVKSIPQEPRPGRKPHKPTHFVCFRVDSPAALQAYQRVQRKVITHLPQSERFWQKPESLHVTLCLLILESPTEVFAASEVLHAVVKKLYKPPISVSFAPKLKHFNGRVLYLPPRPLPDIQNLNAPLQDAFRDKGWLHRHSRHPTYHLTLAKANEEGAERMFEDVGLIRLPKDINFGKLTVDKLYLCLINEPKTVTGFYQTVCVVHLPTV